MSRIGNAPIKVPEGVEVNVSNENVINVKGKLGSTFFKKLIHPLKFQLKMVK